jgi:penicillin-binding protein 1C
VHRRVRLIALGIALLALATPLAYARVAPLGAPEERTAIPGTVVLDAHGVVLARDAMEGTRIPVALDQVAPSVVWATVSAEDRRFWQHPGIDPIAVARAVLRGGSGASTITQQLARRLYLADDTGSLAARKAREALVALQLEAQRSKAQILALYLNDVYYGRGAYGIEAAARAYFGTSARDLDLAHAAYLAGLPQRPSAYDPEIDDGPARARQAYVLARMAEDGWITRAQADAAARRSVALLPAATPRIAPHFVAQALAELTRLRPDLSGRRGLVIETTLDAGLQSEADRLARLHLARLGDRNVTNAAVVAIEPGSGRVLAMVGSATDGDPSHGGEVDMTTALRQPGSALKPLLYAAAFERGFTPATPLLDVPTTFRTERGPYTPLNYDRAFHGIVPLRTALASSLNVPAVRTLETLGVDAMLEISHRFGLATLSTPEAYGLALTLGGGEVRLLDLTSAYAALGASGELATPYAVARVRDVQGRILYERAPSAARRVLAPEHSYLLADILSDPDARILGFGETSPFDLPFPAAAKSGTTTGYRDDWTLGFTPEIAVGVWVGNADGSPMQGVSGVDGAGPIWRDVMSAAAFGRRMTWPSRPAGIVETTVCAPTGLLPGPDCLAPMRELFVSGTQPTVAETFYVRQPDGRVAVDPPAEARAWALEAGYRVVAR